MMCLCRFISCNQGNIPVRNVIIEEAVQEWREIAVLSTQLCCEPKSALKIKFIIQQANKQMVVQISPVKP